MISRSSNLQQKLAHLITHKLKVALELCRLFSNSINILQYNISIISIFIVI